MKEYRLSAWPPLRPPFDRITHRRMASDMSHRHVSLAQLVGSSGARRQDALAFLAMLETHGLVLERETREPEAMFGSLRPLGRWLRLAFHTAIRPR